MRWEDDINDNPPRELPFHLTPKGAMPKPAKEEVKAFDYEREEMINYAMAVTGVMEYEIVAEAMAKVFGKEVPTAKIVHQNTLKIIDAADLIEQEKSIALVNGIEEVKVPKIEADFAEETKGVQEEPFTVENSKSKSHVHHVLNAEGKQVIAPGPNKKCHCGSGDRYKKCCMSADNERTEEAEKAKVEKSTDVSNLLLPLYI